MKISATGQLGKLPYLKIIALIFSDTYDGRIILRKFAVPADDLYRMRADFGFFNRYNRTFRYFADRLIIDIQRAVYLRYRAYFNVIAAVIGCDCEGYRAGGGFFRRDFRGSFYRRGFFVNRIIHALDHV